MTFNAEDCTYKPSLYGPRQLCTKGTPPKPEAKAEPAALPPAAVPAPPPAVAEPPNSEPVTHEANAPATAPPAAPQPPAVARPPAAAPPAAAPPAAAASPPAAAVPPAAAAAPAVSDKCDIAACKQAYFTFNPADCTYQPSSGLRQLCTKGAPPKPEAKVEPAAPPAVAEPPKGEPVTHEANAPATAPPPAAPQPPAVAPPPASAATPPADAAPPAAAAVPPAAAAPAVSDKCDVEACKRAYFTFNPADCTYRPSDGPRRLCTKRAPANSQAAAPAHHARRRAAPFRLLPPGLIPFGR